MSGLIYFQEAEQDVRQIVDRIAMDNPAAALRWLDAIRGVCQLIEVNPRLGQIIRTNRFGEVRRHSSGNYVVYYRAISAGL